MSDKLFLATEVHGLKPEPAPRRGSLRIFVFDSPRLRCEKRSKNKVFTGAAVLAAFVLVLLRGIESLLAARLPRLAISFRRVLDGVLADAVADDELMKKSCRGRTGERVLDRSRRGFLFLAVLPGLAVRPRFLDALFSHDDFPIRVTKE